MVSIQPNTAGNDDLVKISSMQNSVLDEEYARKRLPGWEPPRQPRSPLRDAHSLAPTTTRDKSTSSSEKRDSSVKRNSFFTKRPKSTLTTVSNEGSTRSQTPNPGEPSRPPSTADTPVISAETDTSRSRFLFGRSRKNRQSGGSRLRASSPVDADDEGDHMPIRKDEKHRRSASGDRRMRISNPFGFQHVAKIEKERERKEPSDIFADFRALRRGHRTAIIGPSRELELDMPSPVPPRPQKRPPPLRPKRSDELLAEQELFSPHTQGMLPLRQIRSAETFATGLPQSILPNMRPPRHYANRPPPLNPVTNMLTPDYVPRLSNHPEPSDEWDRLLPLYDSGSDFHPHEMGFRPMPQSEVAPEAIRSPMFSPPLEQVPEEPEGTLSNRQSSDYSRQIPIRHAKSSPILSRDNSKLSKKSGINQPPTLFFTETTITERPVSQGSDTLGDPSRLSVPIQELEQSTSKKGNQSIKTAGVSWEDDVDYCYQHAAEADCDFDWSNTSQFLDDSDDLYRDDGPFPNTNFDKMAKREQSHSMASTASSEGDQYKLTSRVYRVPSKEGVPELDYRSSHSASTNSISVLTPLDKLAFSPSGRDSGKNSLSPQLLPLSELNIPQFYDDVVSKASCSPPSIPPRSDSRLDKMLPVQTQQPHPFDIPQLPTPPPSANQSPTIPIPRNSKPAHQDLSVDTIVAQLRSRALDSPVSPEPLESPEYPPPPPPKSPRTLARKPSGETIPILKPRSHNHTLNAAKLKLIDAQGRLQDLGPTSIARTHSDDSVVTAIPFSSKPPTPPKTPYQVGTPPTSNRSFFSAAPSPSPTQASSTYFTPLTSPDPQQQARNNERQQSLSHRKVSSDSAARIETPPLSPPPPRSPSSVNGVRPTRSSYSLFPPKTRDLPKPLDLAVPVPGVNFNPTVTVLPPAPQPPQVHSHGGFPAALKSPMNALFPSSMKSSRSRDRRLATS